MPHKEKAESTLLEALQLILRVARYENTSRKVALQYIEGIANYALGLLGEASEEE